MAIIVGNGFDYPNSNPGWGCCALLYSNALYTSEILEVRCYEPLYNRYILIYMKLIAYVKLIIFFSLNLWCTFEKKLFFADFDFIHRDLKCTYVVELLIRLIWHRHYLLLSLQRKVWEIGWISREFLVLQSCLFSSL